MLASGLIVAGARPEIVLAQLRRLAGEALVVFGIQLDVNCTGAGGELERFTHPVKCDFGPLSQLTPHEPLGKLVLPS